MSLLMLAAVASEQRVHGILTLKHTSHLLLALGLQELVSVVCIAVQCSAAYHSQQPQVQSFHPLPP